MIWSLSIDRYPVNRAFDLRLDRYGEDNLGLNVGVEGGNADMLADFVPANAVGDGLYEWSPAAFWRPVSGAVLSHGVLIPPRRPDRLFPPCGMNSKGQDSI